MLAIHADTPFSRRRLLTAGGLALGGFSLSHLLAAEAPAKLHTGKAVIFLFQQGGPSQFETFDPKPDAAAEIRTVTGVTKTSVPGVVFGDSMAKLAERADKFTVVRSYATANGEHNIEPIVGPNSLNANIGALYSRVVGPTDPVTSVPTSAIVYPQSVDAKVAKGQGRGDLAATGNVGGAFAPFVAGGTGQLQKNLRLSLPTDRFSDRRELLARLDDLRRDTEPQYEQFDQRQRQACEVLLSGSVADALDLTREDPKVLAAYDTAAFVAKDDWKKADRGKRGYYTGHAKTIGKTLLLARRLCEAGCGFVTIHTGYEGVWDMHADGNNLNMLDGMEAVGRAFDHAVAAFVDDLEARGLADKILLVATGEMGRTPRLNKNGGRDHWSRLAPLLLYGRGGHRGAVVGPSALDGGGAAEVGGGHPNTVSTILHTVFDGGRVRLKPELAAVAKLGEVKPIGDRP